MAIFRNIPTYCASRFTWKDSVGAAECSDQIIPGPVWDDSADVGFYVLSKRTGNRVLFVYAEEIRDSEGELQYLKFQAHDAVLRKSLPFEIRLYND